jgi:hypothetical protein
MARPEKNTVEYFPFICAEGKKMYYLEETYGNDGFATFVKLLRELAKTEYHYLNLNEKTTQMFLASKCKVSKETLISIINDLVDLGKFNAVLWSENKIIWCQDFVDSIQDAYEKRKNKCITFDGLLHLLVSLGVRKPIKSKSIAPDNTQTIVDYTKEEESRLTPPPEFKGEKILGIDYVKAYDDLPDDFKNMYDEIFYKSWLNINKHISDNCKYLRTWSDQITVYEFKKIYDRIDKKEITINQVKLALEDLDKSKLAKDKYNSVYHGFNTYLKTILKNV